MCVGATSLRFGGSAPISADTTQIKNMNGRWPLSSATAAVVVVVTVYALGLATIILAVVRRQQAVRHLHEKGLEPFADDGCTALCYAWNNDDEDDVCDTGSHRGLRQHYRLDSSRLARQQREAFRALSSLVRTSPSDVSSEEEEEGMCNSGEKTETEGNSDSCTTSTMEGEADAKLGVTVFFQGRRGEASRARPPQLRRRTHRCTTTVLAPEVAVAGGSGDGVARTLRLQQPRLTTKEPAATIFSAHACATDLVSPPAAPALPQQQQPGKMLHERSHSSAPTSFGVSRAMSSTNPEEEADENNEPAVVSDVDVDDVDTDAACVDNASDTAQARRTPATHANAAATAACDTVNVARMNGTPRYSNHVSRRFRLSATLSYEADNEADNSSSDDVDGDYDRRQHAAPPLISPTASAPAVTVATPIDVPAPPASGAAAHGSPCSTDRRRGGGLLSATHYSCHGPHVSGLRSEGAQTPFSGRLSPLSATPLQPALGPLPRDSTSCFLGPASVTSSVLTLTDERGAGARGSVHKEAADRRENGYGDVEGNEEETHSASIWTPFPLTRPNSPKYDAPIPLAGVPHTAEQTSDVALCVHVDQPLVVGVRIASTEEGGVAAPQLRRRSSIQSSLVSTPLTGSLSLMHTTHHLLQSVGEREAEALAECVESACTYSHIFEAANNRFHRCLDGAEEDAAAADAGEHGGLVDAGIDCGNQRRGEGWRTQADRIHTPARSD